MKKTQRLVSLVLALAMVLVALFTLAACDHNCEKKGHLWGENGKCTVCGVPNPDADTVSVQYYTTHYGDTPVLIYEESVQLGNKADGCKHGGFVLNGGLKTADGTAFDVATTDISAATKLYGDFVMNNGVWYDPNASYTWRSAPSDLPTNWNYHDYETSSATYVLDYTSDALYTFDYNDDYTAYRIVPSMASGDPIDVTEEYAGQFGIPASADEAYAYKIPLKDNLKFDDGTGINANTFVSSVMNLLNPDAMNFRADNLYSSGNLKIAGAEAYVKGGNYAWQEFVSADYGADEYVMPSDITFGKSLEEGDDTIVAQVTIDGIKYDFGMNINDGGNWGSNSLADYAGAGYFAVQSYATDKARNNWILIEVGGVQVGTLEIGGTAEAPTYTFRDLNNKIVDCEETEDGDVYKQDGVVLENWEGAAPYVTVWQFDAEHSQFKLFDGKGNYVAGRSVYADADGNYEYYNPTTGEKLTAEADITAAKAAVRVMNNMPCYANLEAAADAKGNVKLTESLLKDFQDCIAVLHGFESADARYAYLLNGYTGLYYDALYDNFIYEAAYNASLVANGYDPTAEDFDIKDVTDEHLAAAEKAGDDAVAAKGIEALEAAYTKAYEDYIKGLNLAEGTEPTEDQIAAAKAAGMAAYAALLDADADAFATANAPTYAQGEAVYAYTECQEMGKLARVWEEVPFSTVGFLAPDKDHIVIILVNPMEDNFYLRYELCTSFFLVNNDLYDSCESITNGVYTNSYGTSVATYSGYGPYKLVEYVSGSKLRFERNPYWHGYSEIELVNQYQTSAVEMNVVTSDATRLEMFLKGEVEGYGLTADDMDDYITSPYIYYQDSESTWFVAMNPQVANLTATAAKAKPVTAGNTVIKAPLAIEEFRQALSYSLDRTAFILACSPTSGIAKALLSSVMIADPEDGTPYRSTEEAQDAILEFWGLSDAWGEGKEYGSRAEAIASITGYDLAGAKELFTVAYNKAKEAGYIPDGDKWEFQICIGLPSTANFYTKGYAALTAGWTDAVKGTPWEGHLTFIQDTTLTSSTFADALHEGRVDLLFGVGYSGSMFDPYSFMECFTGSLQYDVFTDMSKIDLDIEIDGSLILNKDGEPAYSGKKVLRGSISQWVSALQGYAFDAKVIVNGEATEEIVSVNAGTSANPTLRLQVMAKAETAILNQSNLLPLMTDASASLRSMRVIYKTEEYILGVGRGGIQYYTYLMDDAEWAAYVAGQGGTLNYKG